MIPPTPADNDREIERLALALYQRGKNEVKLEIYLPYAKAALVSLIAKREALAQVAQLQAVKHYNGYHEGDWMQAINERLLWLQAHLQPPAVQPKEGEA